MSPVGTGHFCCSAQVLCLLEKTVSAVSRFGHESFRPWVVSAWVVRA